jgi:hypothetical protein
MGLDIRIPIGLLLALIGLLLSAYGLASDHLLFVRSQGVNVNLWWGGVLAAAGVLFLLAALRARRRGV